MAIKTGHDLFAQQLKDIYSAEKQTVRAYPKIAKRVSSPELKGALGEHLEETRGQIERLHRVFEILEKKSSGQTCKAMKGLVSEAEEAVEEIKRGPVLDASLLAAVQRIEHYEIASYGTVVAFAELVEEEEVGRLLAETLEEEKAANERLTKISGAINSASIGKSGKEEGDLELNDTEDEGDEPPPARKVAPRKSTGKKSARKIARR